MPLGAYRGQFYSQKLRLTNNLRIFRRPCRADVVPFASFGCWRRLIHVDFFAHQCILWVRFTASFFKTLIIPCSSIRRIRTIFILHEQLGVLQKETIEKYIAMLTVEPVKSLDANFCCFIIWLTVLVYTCIYFVRLFCIFVFVDFLEFMLLCICFRISVYKKLSLRFFIYAFFPMI